jgi:NAD(P)-dependent dehydrogenase (short-subunit alcohol dehydrogenase family)
MDAQRPGRVAGKMTLITGAAGGIGAGCATVFAREGARLLLADRDAAALRTSVDRIAATGAEVHAEVADIADEAQVERMVRRAEAIGGRLDILVSNAGIARFHTIEETSMEEWDEVMRTNMRGSFLVAKQAIGAMRRGEGGSIVITSSISALVGLPKQAAYAPSKAYVQEMTRQLALDYAPHNIRVNAVCPGAIMTGILEGLAAAHAEPERFLRDLAAAYPLGRIGRAEEVGWAVLFLASDEASFITGACLPVDGGYVAR